ncbi:hypothetical protein WG947_10435 [Pontibacter sp. H259]
MAVKLGCYNTYYYVRMNSNETGEAQHKFIVFLSAPLAVLKYKLITPAGS